MNITRLLSLTFTVVALQITAAEEPKAVERDGSTKEKAILITADSDFAGVHEKHQWILDHYPGAQFGPSAFVEDHGRYYDVDTFTTADGQEKTLWFDITRSFGKW
jgi:hypothetical protein